MGSWSDEELAGCTFSDVRLRNRFMTIVERLSEGIGETIPMAFQDWANTKAVTKQEALECKRRIRNFRKLQKQIEKLLRDGLANAPWTRM